MALKCTECQSRLRLKTSIDNSQHTEIRRIYNCHNCRLSVETVEQVSRTKAPKFATVEAPRKTKPRGPVDGEDDPQEDYPVNIDDPVYRGD